MYRSGATWHGDPVPSLSADDRAELADLAAAYAHAVDRRRFEQLRRVFTADGVLHTPTGSRRGHAEIESAMGRLHRYEATFHVLGQQRLAATAEGASGETYCVAHHLRRHDDGRVDSVMYIRYLDRFAATADGWRIAERRLEVDWTDDRSVT